MKLEWKTMNDGTDDVEAEGSGSRSYTVWDEGTGQHIAEVDSLQLGYGDKAYCLQKAQEHEDMVAKRGGKMSHWSRMTAVVTDLDALAAAAETMGAQALLNEKARGWRKGLSDKDAALVLRIPNSRFDVAVVPEGDGTYRLEGDLYDKSLEKFFGKGFDSLGEYYQAERLKAVARRNRRSTKTKLSTKGHLMLEVAA